MDIVTCMLVRLQGLYKNCVGKMIMPSFNEGGAYCFAYVSRYVGWSPTTCTNYTWTTLHPIDYK